MSDLPYISMEEEFKMFRDNRFCYNVFKLPYEERCNYVDTSGDCLKPVHFVDYLRLFVCIMDIRRRRDEIKVIALFFLILFISLLAIVIIAKKYYAPAMKVAAHLLHMNEHLAGVTILALGNTAPHVLEHLINVDSDLHIFTNSMAFSLFGVLISGGLVCFISPIKMNAHATTRDLLFFLLGTQIISHLLYNFKININECLLLLGYYGVYITVLLVDHFLLKNQIRKVQDELKLMKSHAHRDHFKEKIYEEKLTELIFDAGVELKSMNKKLQSSSANRERTRTIFYSPGAPQNRYLFSEFFESLTPIDWFKWEKSNNCGKVLLVIQIPINFFCRLYIPEVNVEENKHGWSKLLNCLQIILTPSISMLLISTFQHANPAWHIQVKFAYFLYPMPLTVLLAVAVFYQSRTDIPPPYHFAFALMSIFASIFIIFLCVSETVAIIDILGYLIGLSFDFMGATLGALSASIGDIAINLEMARHGYEEMAFAATLGGPFFNLICATGFMFIVKTILSDNKEISVDPGLFGETCFIFIILAISMTLLWASILNFRSRRSVGIYSLILYGIYFLMAVLAEAEIIHTYESDIVIPFPNI